MISGEAGIGKSTLLDQVGRTAEGFQLLRVTGVESESTLDHLGLHSLFAALRPVTAGIPARQRGAIDGVLGWGPAAQATDRHLVGPATLSVLAAAAASTPVLVVVDDLHWLDVGSTAALLFAARRLGSDQVAMLFAARSELLRPAITGIDVILLEGLTEAEASNLLPRGTAPQVARRLRGATGGNPLALVEVAARLTTTQAQGITALPDPLPIGDRLETLYRPLIERLSPAGRYAVLLLAASRSSAAAILPALVERFGESETALREIEDNGLVERDAVDLRFRHPLVRSTVWAMAQSAERRAAHAALAACISGQSPTRAWHLAEAATAPDDTLAAELERYATADRTRLGYASASASLERAAKLSIDQRAAANRMAAAIENAALSGDLERARSLAMDLLDRDGPDEAQGRATAVLGAVEHTTGSVPRASQLLRRAAEQTDGLVRVRVLADLAMVYHRLGDYTELIATGHQLATVADQDDPEQRFLSSCYTGIVALAQGDSDEAKAQLTTAFDIYHVVPSVRDDPRHLPLATLTAATIELTGERARFLEERLEHARSIGALAVLVPVLAMFSYGRAFLLGDHLGAFADAGEAVELGYALGIVADTAPAVEMLAWQNAARGNHDQATSLLIDAAGLVDRAGTTLAAAHLALTRAFCALCRADFSEITAILEARLELDGGRGAMGEPLGVAPLLVEAYMATGRRDEAVALTTSLAALPSADPTTAALIVRCQALTAATDDQAVERFEQRHRHARSHGRHLRAGTDRTALWIVPQENRPASASPCPVAERPPSIRFVRPRDVDPAMRVRARSQR